LGSENIGSIVSADLARSGRFKTLSEDAMLEQPTSPEQVQFRTWQALGQDNLAIGQVQQTGPGQFAAQFHLFDAVRGTLLTTYRIPFAESELRKTAHRIADIIYQQLTGEPGAFATRVAYVTVSGDGPRNRQYMLQVADTDGFNPQSIITSREPVMSPAWSRDGSTIVFTSDRGGKPQLYMVPAGGGQAQRLTYEGAYNARGVFSPDGKSLAMVHGNGNDFRIAVMDLQSKHLRVLTKGTLDESPGFAPNGSMILYASRTNGAGQLSAVSIDGKVRQSLRIDSGEVREPAWSP
jgi:TolB protein